MNPQPTSKFQEVPTPAKEQEGIPEFDANCMYSMLVCVKLRSDCE
jgi:hypothetical protein